MKRRITILLLLVLAVGMLCMSGCQEEVKETIGKFGKVSNGLFLYSDLAVQDSFVDSFDTKRYVLSEYRALLNEELAEYNKTHPFNPGDPEKRSKKEPDYHTAITVVTCETSGQKLVQQLLYATPEDFLEYNAGELAKRKGSVLKVGTLDRVDTSILTMSYVSPAGKEISVQELCALQNAGDYRYMICDLEALIYGDGQIICFSTNATYNEENICVSARGGEKVVVIFK